MKRFIVSSVIVLLAIMCLGLAYVVVDNAVTVQHLTEGAAREVHRSRLLARLVLELPRDAGQDGCIAYLDESFPGEIVKRCGNVIEFASIILIFEEDRLVQVDLM